MCVTDCDVTALYVVRSILPTVVPPSDLAPLVVRGALEDVRLAVRAQGVADVRIERMRVGRERVVGVGGVGMRRVERIVGRGSRARTRMHAGSTVDKGDKADGLCEKKWNYPI
ncbi:hypothetical protein RP20_CCG018026 [Aedes albopictus]|nr:hypothetical protein RP20_CCG018026 [Aedes albopictus]